MNNVAIDVRMAVDELIYLVAVGETTKRCVHVPQWLVKNDILWWSVDVGLPHRDIEQVLMAEPDIRTIQDLCEYIFSGRLKPKIRR